MKYEVKDTASECKMGSGGSQNTSSSCKSIPFADVPPHLGTGSYPQTFEDSEADCIFPFIFNGTKYTSCALYNINGLTFPVFLCPIRTIKGQYEDDGTPWYTVDDMRAVGMSSKKQQIGSSFHFNCYRWLLPD